MSKQPKPVRAWGVFGPRGYPVSLRVNKDDAKELARFCGGYVVFGTFTPDPPKAKKKKARKR